MGRCRTQKEMKIGRIFRLLISCDLFPIYTADNYLHPVHNGSRASFKTNAARTEDLRARSASPSADPGSQVFVFLIPDPCAGVPNERFLLDGVAVLRSLPF